MQKYTLPDIYQQKIESLLQSYGHSLDQPKPLASAILKLSDHYQSETRITPWKSADFVAAYAAYYFPLNYVRNLKIWQETLNVGFPKNISQIIDFGCGLGSSLLAGNDSHIWGADTSLFAIDHMPEPLELLKKHLLPERTFLTSLPSIKPGTLGIFSYSWNELPHTPPWLFDLDHLLILEPSTSLHSRKLSEFRQKLMEKKFSIWAPCTHTMACPLLTHSKTDWCHDRVHWDPPAWFERIEALLPIKNNTLTVSYLLASKTKTTNSYFGRIVGDELKEKGKTRWMFCRDDKREFLSHLSRLGEAPNWKRGTLFKEPIPHEPKANELRIK